MSLHEMAGGADIWADKGMFLADWGIFLQKVCFHQMPVRKILLKAILNAKLLFIPMRIKNKKIWKIY